MKQSFLILLITILLSLGAAAPVSAQSDSSRAPGWWSFQSIDTMKFSRDVSREFLSNRARLAAETEAQVKQIAATGVTHVAIATPYDDEFLPVLESWVAAARRHDLKVWFRGNWSGWEGWFGYPRISRQQHLAQTEAFILAHPQLFADGDYFSACPECENGGPGDPRLTGDVDGHRRFLIEQHQLMTRAFAQLNKQVDVSFNSMNGDVARLIMDPPTTAALGGRVVVDHYVRTPLQLNADVTEFARRSGGKVILGEFGAPIPDIHGRMTDRQQQAWIGEALVLLANNPHLEGINYWTSQGGSTALWTDTGQPKPAVETLRNFFRPQLIDGQVWNTLGQPVTATLISSRHSVTTDADGRFRLPYRDLGDTVQVQAAGYQAGLVKVADLQQQPTIRVIPEQLNWWYQLHAWWLQLATQFRSWIEQTELFGAL